jgi:hypothetical protein
VKGPDFPTGGVVYGTKDPKKYSPTELHNKLSKLVENHLTENDDVKIAAANDWISVMKKSGRVSQTHSPESMNGTVVASVRDWGSWHVPDGEDDGEGDYDWEVLSDSSSKSLKDLVDKFKSRYSKLKIYVSQEEKRWISIQIN